MDSSVLLKTDLPLPLYGHGKVRDTYELGDLLLIVATDRISAFDVILPCGIPGKGKVLNRMSAFWFNLTRKIMPNHMVEPLEDIRRLDDLITSKKRFKIPEYLIGRSMLVKKMARVNIECVLIRGYLAGSAWDESDKKAAYLRTPVCPEACSKARSCQNRFLLLPLRLKKAMMCR